MNLIRCTSRLLRTSKLQYKPILPVRGAIYLDKDWQPGPYPKTEAERLAAAKKYNLLPEEYEAYDPEKWEFSYGDYPLLPNICQDDKDPYYAWDYPAWKYNYGEVIHVNEELYQFDRLTLRPVTDIPFKEVVLVYFLALGFIYLLFIHKPSVTPFLKKKMQKKNKLHKNYKKNLISFQNNI
ncbi:hypothetical protein PGB90_008905 [Kerria lacca]